jgi:hypothetical protein
MATTTSYIQLPPDGVGKKVRHRLVTDVVTNVISNTPAINGTVWGSNSGAQGTFLGAYNAPDGTVSWYINVVSGTFNTADTLQSLSGGGTTYATVATGGISTSVYEPSVSISDAKIPEYTLSVDSKGAAYTRFQEGTPQFDAWGHMQVSQMQAAGEYYHYVKDLADRYFTTTTRPDTQAATNGTVTHNPNTSSMVYTTTTASGDYARRSTAQYHPYKPGVSQLVYTSLAITLGGGNTIAGGGGNATYNSSALATNKIFEWGYFDDNNGFGFRLNSDGYLYVFLRTDSSGVPTETVVRQDYWNVNTLTSATQSDFLLDWSKNNLWWMDVQGTIGRIRLGVETQDGRRITCHQFTPIESSVGPSCRNMSLPLSWIVSNFSQTYTLTNGIATSVAVSGRSASAPTTAGTLRVGAGVVMTETSDIKYSGQYLHITPDDDVIVPPDNVYHPFLQFKAKNTVAGPVQTAGTFVAGANYTIVSVGSTDFTAIGAYANIPGHKFTATNIGSGTGTAYMNIPNSIIGIHETFDWASNSAANLHVGIFVIPGETWINGIQWSETIQPYTMLYTDQKATDFAQYQYWTTSAYGSPVPQATQIQGTISGNTLTLTAGATGINGTGLLKEMYITKPPLYPSGPLYVNGTAQYAAVTGAIADRTKVLTQLTATGATGTMLCQATVAAQSGGGGAGSNKLIVSTITGATGTPVMGSIIAGTTGAFQTGTFVEGINYTGATGTPTLVLNKPIIANGATGAIFFYNPGGQGTYQLTVGGKDDTTSNNGVTISGYGAYLAMKPQESFFAPGNSAGRIQLGDRIEKSFGLGQSVFPSEDAKGVFVFGVKNLSNPNALAGATGALGASGATGLFQSGIYGSLFYTKFWKEMR